MKDLNSWLIAMRESLGNGSNVEIITLNLTLYKILYKEGVGEKWVSLFSIVIYVVSWKYNLILRFFAIWKA